MGYGLPTNRFRNGRYVQETTIKVAIPNAHLRTRGLNGCINIPPVEEGNTETTSSLSHLYIAWPHIQFNICSDSVDISHRCAKSEEHFARSSTNQIPTSANAQR